MTVGPGTRIGPYEAVVPIGAGGMGEVWKARDTRLDRLVAIKVSKQEFSERFGREARAIAALNHANICTLHDVGPNYLVMELVDGPTLADRIQHGALPIDEVLDIARQIAAALEAAHEAGIVHRDLKPANIKIRPDGSVKVLDFGLAKVGAESAVSTAESPTRTVFAEPAITEAGLVLGTAAYMSPEQARGKPLDRRADIWAFGVVLYELLTGRHAFSGETATDILASVVKDEPDLSVLPAHVRPVIGRCLSKDPRNRWRDARDVVWAMEQGEAPAARPPVGRPAIWHWLVAVVSPPPYP
jgi:serine/threonine-protein kinase